MLKKLAISAVALAFGLALYTPSASACPGMEDKPQVADKDKKDKDKKVAKKKATKEKAADKDKKATDKKKAEPVKGEKVTSR